MPWSLDPSTAPAGPCAHDDALPSVSVVIRNRNESRYLRQVLTALRHQTVRPREIVVVDNDSTDESVATALELGATVVPLARDAFSYGRALNVGMRAATGEVCVILSAHALPLGPGFLESCAAAFHDAGTAAVRCVHVGKQVDLLRWCDAEMLDGRSSVEEIVSRGPLANGCAVRRSTWEVVPFDEAIEAAEEKVWAAEVLARGYRILSPCPAFYAYLKPIAPAAARRKNFRELRAVYEALGQRVGALRGGLPGALADALRTLGVGVPRSIVRTAHAELVGAALHLAFAVRSATRPVRRPAPVRSHHRAAAPELADSLSSPATETRS
jgi:hypothetical protein